MEELYIKVKDLEINSVERYFKGKDLITVWDLVNAIDELLYEKEELEEQKEALEGEKFNPYKEYGINEGDFH